MTETKLEEVTVSPGVFVGTGNRVDVGDVISVGGEVGVLLGGPHPNSHNVVNIVLRIITARVWHFMVIHGF